MLLGRVNDLVIGPGYWEFFPLTKNYYLTTHFAQKLTTIDKILIIYNQQYTYLKKSQLPGQFLSLNQPGFESPTWRSYRVLLSLLLTTFFKTKNPITS